jgi:hypothetical protein
MRIRRMAMALAVASALGIAPTAANAAPLPPGGVVVPGAAAYFGGAILGSVDDCFANAAVTGCARSVVVRNAGGTLDFYYQFTHTSGSPINAMSAFNFGGFSTDVYNIANGSAIGGTWTDGTIASIMANRSGNGESVGWDYAPQTHIPSTTSLAFVIRTNAVNYTVGNYGLIDGVTQNVAAFAPADTVIPEPATVVLLASGILGLAAARRRRNRKDV